MSGDGTHLRIGEVARAVGTTPRTIRYYEEIGLLGAQPERVAGRHRVYTPEEAARLRDALSLRDLLGLTLEELGSLLEANEARSALRAEWHEREPDESRRRGILDEAIELIGRQVELVDRRFKEIERFRTELIERRESLIGQREALGPEGE